MSGPVDLDLVKSTLAARIDSLVPQLYPAAVRDGRHWALGDVHGAPGQSLKITRTGPNAGCFKDFAGTAQGSALDLIAHALFAGRVDHEVVHWAANWCGLGTLSPAEQRLAADRARIAAAEAAQAEATRIEKKRASAKALWLNAQPYSGTPAETYMKGRAIDFVALGRAPGALRFAPDVWCAELRLQVPAMLAYVYNPAIRGQAATHRTYLSRGDLGAWRKNASLKDPKKTLGSFKGGHIPIWRGAHDGPLHELPQGTWIATAEGIENAASVAMERPDLRCIAHISMANLGALVLPENIGGLYIAADNDPPGSEGERAFAAELARLEARSIPYKLIRAPAGIKDMNDWRQAAQAQRKGAA